MQVIPLRVAGKGNSLFSCLARPADFTPLPLLPADPDKSGNLSGKMQDGHGNPCGTGKFLVIFFIHTYPFRGFGEQASGSRMPP
jgi:hypothetical protein